MGKGRKLALIGLSGAVIAGIVVYCLGPGEPVYKGRRLSGWLERGDTAEARQVMDWAGTNAVPVLLRMLEVTDTPQKLKIVGLLGKVPLLNYKYVPAEERNRRAASAFGMLGTNAGFAVPGLIRIYDSAMAADKACAAAFALGCIGPRADAAIPSLLRGAGRPDAPVRQSAIRALGQIQGRPELVVPALASALSDSNETVRVESVFALETYGTNASPALPALRGALQDSSGAVRSLAVRALERINPDQREQSR